MAIEDTWFSVWSRKGFPQRGIYPHRPYNQDEFFGFFLERKAPNNHGLFLSLLTWYFPKQFTVGVLNATLDLAALVLVGVAAFLGSAVVLSPVVSGCLPLCGGWVLVGVAASRTKTFRNQNQRFQSKFAYCKLFGVYAGVIQDFFSSSCLWSSNCIWCLRESRQWRKQETKMSRNIGNPSNSILKKSR